MSYTCFELTVKNGIAHIRLNRPSKANSMVPEFWRELPDAVNEISRNASARVIILSAEGRNFCSGMDISVFTQEVLNGQKGGNPQIRAEAFRYHVKMLQDTFTALEEARMPVLAAIQGAAIGGAIDLITACDCRYATEDAFFSVHETAIGMTADVGTYPRLAKLIPEGWVRQLSYTAERLPAQRAKEIGLINEVYENPKIMLEAVLSIASQIANHAPLAVTGAKRMINYSRDHSTQDGLDYVGLWSAAMLDNEAIKQSLVMRADGKIPIFEELLPIEQSAME